MKLIAYLLLLIGCLQLSAQTISPQVINSAGSSRILSGTGITVDDNVGEPFTETLGSAGTPVITQGFIQPLNYQAANFVPAITVNHLTCTDRKDGRISVAITAAIKNYSITYIWTPTVNCPAANCTAIDSLNAGTYTLLAIANYTTLTNTAKTDTIADTVLVVRDDNGPCKIKVFTGVSINGDGQNDHLYIENITLYPNNRVTVYNRWGTQLYDQRGYDNTSKFWPGDDEQSKLVPSTYFYVLDLGNGSKPIKGWVELIKN